MLWQRQVKRVISADYSAYPELQAGAMRQISTAWILHVDAMIDSLKWDISQILHLSCSYCGRHHLYHAYSRHWGDGSWEYCDYGWWFSVRLIFRKAKFHLMQGID